MKRDLTALRAPRDLVRAAGRAARDEVRHARSTSALARRHGAHLAPADVPNRAPTPADSPLEALATDNAVEGCVRETYGALLATWAAERAGDPHVRAAFVRIARDETRHANLAWSLARWAERRRDRPTRRRVRSLGASTVEHLARAVTAEVPRALVDAGVLPSAAEAARLVASLRRSLWDRAYRPDSG